MRRLLYRYISVLILFIVTCGNFSFGQELSINTTGGCLTGVGNECLVVEINPENPATPESIAQDIVFSATYMVGTVLTIVIIVCGLGYIFSSASGKDTSKYKKGLISSAIGAVLVRGAYAIVRLIQYIARG